MLYPFIPFALRLSDVPIITDRAVYWYTLCLFLVHFVAEFGTVYLSVFGTLYITTYILSP